MSSVANAIVIALC